MIDVCSEWHLKQINELQGQLTACSGYDTGKKQVQEQSNTFLSINKEFILKYSITLALSVSIKKEPIFG